MEIYMEFSRVREQCISLHNDTKNIVAVENAIESHYKNYLKIFELT